MTIAGILTPGREFVTPGPADFELPPVFSIGSFGVTKPMLLAILGAIVVFGYFWSASRRREMIPGRLQFSAEGAYNFVRNSLARDIIGSRDFMRYVPYLVALFFFILINNLFGSIPFIQFPTFSRIGFVYALTLISWLVYIGAGINRHGLVGYFKHQCVPAGVGPLLLVLLIPLEFLSNIIVRPVTLALRLFANMFAGHLLVILFSMGGLYLIQMSGLTKVAGPVAWIMVIAIGFLELLVQALQAYVFVLLNAMYIQGAISDDH